MVVSTTTTSVATVDAGAEMETAVVVARVVMLEPAIHSSATAVSRRVRREMVACDPSARSAMRASDPSVRSAMEASVPSVRSAMVAAAAVATDRKPSSLVGRDLGASVRSDAHTRRLSRCDP